MPVDNSASHVPFTTIVEPSWLADANPDGHVDVVDWLEVQGPVLSIVRSVICGDTTCTSIRCWKRTYDDADHAQVAFETLNTDASRIVFWSAGALALGPAWLSPILDRIVEEQHVERRDAADQAEKAREEEEARLKADEAITAYTMKHKGSFRLTLERGGCSDPVWWIDFEEAWERDRFYDWFGWQDSRFEQFAVHMEAGGNRLALERALLCEMLVIEQTVRKQGLGSGGRRPLRFWRGEL